jgi:hypothetical protein
MPLTHLADPTAGFTEEAIVSAKRIISRPKRWADTSETTRVDDVSHQVVWRCNVSTILLSVLRQVLCLTDLRRCFNPAAQLFQLLNNLRHVYDFLLLSVLQNTRHALSLSRCSLLVTPYEGERDELR